MTRPLRDHVGDSQVFCEHKKLNEARQLADDVAMFQAGGGMIQILGHGERTSEIITKGRKRGRGKPDSTLTPRKVVVISLEQADEER